MPLTHEDVEAQLNSGGIKRQQAIWYVYQLQYNDLLRKAADYLFESKDYDDHRAVLRVLHAYGESLENYLPDWYLFIDRYMKESTPPDLLKQCFDLAVIWEEQRLMTALIRFASHPLSEVRHAAFEAMSKMGSDIIIPEMLRLISSPRPIFKVYALEGAALYPDARLAPFVLRLLNDPNKSIRIYAIEAVSRNPRLIDQVIRLYTLDSDNEVKQRIVELIGRFGWRSHFYIVQSALGDPSPLVRRSALGAVEQVSDPFSAPYISTQLARESDPELRRLALDVLLLLRKGGGGAGLSSVLEHESDESMRIKAAIIAGLSREYGTAQALIQALMVDLSAAVRLEAANAMGLIRSQKFFEPLKTVILNETEGYEIRSGAILSLLEINRKEGVEFLAQNRERIANLRVRKQIEAILAAESEE